jgi:hypothetical protein
VTPPPDDPERRTPTDLADRLLDVKRIYHEPDIERLPRAVQVLDRWPDAERVEVPSHQSIPGLYGNEGNVEDWRPPRRSTSAPPTSPTASPRSTTSSTPATRCTSTSVPSSSTRTGSPIGLELLEQLADGTNDRTKAQLAAEIIFLTHNEALHNVNLGWHPKGEDLLWRPIYRS